MGAKGKSLGASIFGVFVGRIWSVKFYLIALWLEKVTYIKTERYNTTNKYYENKIYNYSMLDFKQYGKRAESCT